MADVKVLVEVIGGEKLVATLDSSSTAQAAAEVLSGLVKRPLVDEDGKKKNWKLFAPGATGNIAPLQPHGSLSVASTWAASLDGPGKGGFAGPGEHEGQAYAYRIRFFVPKPPPPKKAPTAPEPIQEEEALDLTDMVEIDALESVRHVPGAQPPKKKRRKKKRAPGEAATGEMAALSRPAAAAPGPKAADTGEVKRRKKKKRADTGEVQAHTRPDADKAPPPSSTGGAAEATVRSDPGEATVRSEPPPTAPPAPIPESLAAPAAAEKPTAPLSPAEAARQRVEAARARVEAAKAAAAKAEEDAAKAAKEAAVAEKAAAEKAAAEKAAAEKAAADKAAAEKAAAEEAAAEKAAADKAAADKAAAEKAAAEKAVADKAAADKAAADKAAADKAAAEKAAADKAAAEKAAADKAAADKAAADKASADKAAAAKAAADKAAADKAAAEKAAAEKAAAVKATNKANTERVVAMSPVTQAAPEPGQQPVTAKTRTLTRSETSAALGADSKKEKTPPPLGGKPAKKASNAGLFVALGVLLVVAVCLGYALLTRDKGTSDSDADAPAPKAAASAPRLSEDLRLAPYTTGEGTANDAVDQAVTGFGSLNIATAKDLKSADARRKAGMVADALEKECRDGSRFDACDGWSRISFALYAGCADGGCNGQERDLLIQASITATDLALTRGIGLADPAAKEAATRLLVAQAIRLGSQNQKLVAAKAPRVATLGLRGCAGAAAGTADCQALTRTR